MNRRSWLRVVTPTGWYVAVVALVGVACGIAWGWVEAWFVAVIGVLLLLAALPFLYGTRAYRIKIVPDSGSVVAGSDLRVAVEVTNTSARPQLPAVAELAVSDERANPEEAGDALLEVPIPLIGPRQSARIPVHFEASSRGVLRLGPITVTRRDPLGLLRRELSWRERHLVHVHPKTTNLPPQSAGLVRDLEGRASRRLTDSDLSFHAVREYVPGDAVRNVHWKTTAKTGTLMVRQFEESQAARLAVLFDTRVDEYADAEEFELGVSIAASLSLQAVRSGRDHFVAASRDAVGAKLIEFPTHNPVLLLDTWSELDASTGGPRIEEIAHALAATRRSLSLVVFVTGSQPELGRLRKAATAFPPDVRVLAVRCERFGDPRVQRIDPLTLCNVGALDDLPGLMLRGAL